MQGQAKCRLLEHHYQIKLRSWRYFADSRCMKLFENTSFMNSESHWRSVMKSISWRLIATLTTVVLVWAITGRAEWALTIGSGELILKLLLYYLHERAWDRVPSERV